MKVLWFSNFPLGLRNNKLSGSWLYSMSELLVGYEGFNLVNVTISDSLPSKTQIYNNFVEYCIKPIYKYELSALPESFIKEITSIIDEERPDIIHIWGVEGLFASAFTQINVDYPVLLEIQGFHGACADVYYGDLSLKEITKCFGLREILFPFSKSIIAMRRKMKTLGDWEDSIINQYKFISTQSNWVRHHINNPHAVIFKTGMSIRNSFWTSAKWYYSQKNHAFYSIASAALPYKSVQTAIRAISIAKKKIPDIRLYIIGDYKVPSSWIHRQGYSSYIRRVIKKLGVEENVIFTGPKTAEEIVEISTKCAGMVQTSYVESYSLALAEAQVIGLPSVVSFAGAMPELATDYKSALFYQPGDYYSCAAKMIELIENKELSESISLNSISTAKERNNNKVVLDTQISIYKDIIKRYTNNDGA